MDEAFSHLAVVTARDLRGELQGLWKNTGATVLFVPHDVMEAVLRSNPVLMMSSAGVIFRDVAIDLPHPRLQTDREVATLQAEILALFEEMESKPIA